MRRSPNGSDVALLLALAVQDGNPTKLSTGLALLGCARIIAVGLLIHRLI